MLHNINIYTCTKFIHIFFLKSHSCVLFLADHCPSYSCYTDHQHKKKAWSYYSYLDIDRGSVKRRATVMSDVIDIPRTSIATVAISEW